MEMLTLEDEEAVYLRSRVWDLDPGRWYPDVSHWRALRRAMPWWDTLLACT